MSKNLCAPDDCRTETGAQRHSDHFYMLMLACTRARASMCFRVILQVTYIKKNLSRYLYGFPDLKFMMIYCVMYKFLLGLQTHFFTGV